MAYRIFHVDTLSYSGDEELYSHNRDLKRRIDDEQLDHHSCRDIEEDLCYVQREMEIRRRRSDFARARSGRSFEHRTESPQSN